MANLDGNAKIIHEICWEIWRVDLDFMTRIPHWLGFLKTVDPGATMGC